MPWLKIGTTAIDLYKSYRRTEISILCLVGLPHFLLQTTESCKIVFGLPRPVWGEITVAATGGERKKNPFLLMEASSIHRKCSLDLSTIAIKMCLETEFSIKSRWKSREVLCDGTFQKLPK